MQMHVYIQWFSRFPRSVAENVNMFRVQLTDEYSVVPLTKLRQTVHLVPDFTHLKVDGLKWTAENVFEKCKVFFLNDFLSQEAFKALY